MRIWKIMTLVGILVWGVSSAQNVFAQSGAELKSSPGMKRDTAAQGKDPVIRHLESMTRQLGLSSEQQEAIKPILADEAVQLKELRANSNLTVAEKKAKMQELRQATFEKIRPVLTAEQQNKHDAQLKNVMERRKKQENKGTTTLPAK